MKKSTYKTIAEALVSGGLKKTKLPTSRVDHRRLTIDEIKNFITEEFGKVKQASEAEIEEKPRGWSDDVLVKQIEWIKKLDLKEIFFSKKEK